MVSGGNRVFVVKLPPDGSSLAWTRYVGPTGDLTEADVAVDDAGRLYVVGETNHTDFPTTPGAYDRECRDRSIPGPCIDAYVARFTTGGAHVATTMLGGGDSHETGTSVAIDRAGRPVIAGTVGVPMYGFPNTPGTYGETPEPSGAAAFVARLSADLAQLEWAAAFGGRDGDHVLGLALDAQDRPVVVGSTDSRDYPTTPGALDRQCNNSDEWYSCPGTPDGFATKLTADGSALVWSTYLGGYGEDIAHAVAADGDGVAIAGATSHAQTFPLRDPYQAQVRYFAGAVPGPVAVHRFVPRAPVGLGCPALRHRARRDEHGAGARCGRRSRRQRVDRRHGVLRRPAGHAGSAAAGARRRRLPDGGRAALPELQRWPARGVRARDAGAAERPGRQPSAPAPPSAAAPAVPLVDAGCERDAADARSAPAHGAPPRARSGGAAARRRPLRVRRSSPARAARARRLAGRPACAPGKRGHFSVRLPAKGGRYRVRAPAVTRDGVLCAATRAISGE